MLCKQRGLLSLIQLCIVNWESVEFIYNFVCCSTVLNIYILHYEFDELCSSDLELEVRLLYIELAGGTSAREETVPERGWKFVFPTNQ